jgi:peptide/nickel transport system substrate-binding protein
VEAFIYSKGAYAYGGYPDIDALFQQQAVERDRSKREAILHGIQELSMERVMYAPIMDFRALMGVGRGWQSMPSTSCRCTRSRPWRRYD